MPKRILTFLFAFVPLAVFAANSAPVAQSASDTILPARDVPFPGTLTLAVDASDVMRGIFQITEKIPVSAAGPLTLLYSEWIPGKHRPFGQLPNLAGLKISAEGKALPWTRDPVDVFAFHVEVPAGVSAIEAQFQFLAPTDGAQGRIVTTPDLLNLQWESVSLYPAGHYVRQITIAPTVKFPDGWKAATALEVAASDGNSIRYKPVSYETLVDSPIFAGANFRTETLAPGVRLNIVADRPEQLAATEEQLQLHRNLVTQAVKLFGAQHYDHYDFLFALSSRLGGIGVEHQRSSEDGVEGDYFTDWKASLIDHDLLPHEYTHSWNGKYRRPADLWTPDYRTPMRDSLLWVYEGQTQFWGEVLAARAGLTSKQDTLDALALTAATYDTRAGRSWRTLADTTNDPVVAARRPKGWVSWQRAEDYYSEGLLLWLDADSLIRELSRGKRSLDDFARAFFGVNDRDWGQLTYTFDDVVKTLDGVQPHDWATFLHERVDKISEHAPLEGFTRGGYRLVYTDTATDWFKSNEKKRKITDLSYSGGLTLGAEGAILGVAWDSPAFNAGLTVGTKIIALSNRAFDADQFKAAIKAKKPLNLLVRTGDIFRTVELNYHDGLRYPRLEKIPGSPAAGSLDALLAPKP
ncbi:MAG: peptidase domain protein [Lacunisphaera sp.]|nr:peptidase domain protein [Lacunisphaera sp.]